MDQVRVSIIIPTYNGASKLPFLLDALALQTIRDFEIIIVVDGSIDNTLAVLEKYKTIFQDFKIKNEQNAGRSVTRNHGVREAIGDLLIFYDDDMIPFQDSVQKHIEFHKSYAGAMVTGNAVELKDKSKTDIQNYKAYLNAKWLAPYNGGVTSLDFSNLFFLAANSSMSKEVFLRLNGFDEQLTDAEDYDLAYRALEMDIAVYFDKTNKAIHQEYITARSYINRGRLYWAANLKLDEIHPYRRKVRSVRGNWMKRMVYRLFANLFFVYLIDKDILKRIVPKNLRYKFYDIVIQSLTVEFTDLEV